MIPLLTLPISDPVLKFLIILVIILMTPLLLNRLRIPQLIGLIIAGAIIGPNGFNLVLRDSSIILSGTAGLLYIMFLAGLEIDLNEFKKNSGKSLVFGLYTFLIPMGLGYVIGTYVLNFPVLTSILLASMFASHTLIAYPIISKLGITKDKSVTITVGGTVITDTLALLVLTIIVGMTNGEVDSAFWIRLGVSVAVFALLVMLLFPVLSRWFFKHVDDSVSQYVFVLALVFTGAYLAHVAGLEPIIGAFLAGMALNRQIAATSPLMNRIEFVGNAIFIPFFLIGVGMLIDYRAFFKDWETIKVGAIMVITATAAKWLASWFTQKTFRMSVDQRKVIFGLSNAQAAATLAAVMVGYNVILGTNDDGTPIRLLNDAVLNGTILMILVTCTMASFSAQKGARNIALSDVSGSEHANGSGSSDSILIALRNENSVKEVIDLATASISKGSRTDMYALFVADTNNDDEKTLKRANKILRDAAVAAAATDHEVKELLRYDVDRGNAIAGVVRELRVTDLFIEMPDDFNVQTSLFFKTNDPILSLNTITTIVYNPIQPFGTIRRHLVVIPDKAEREVGFSLWIKKLWKIAASSGAKLVFYTSQSTRNALKDICKKNPIECEFKQLYDWNDFLIISREVRTDDCIWVVMSRREGLSYSPGISKIPASLKKYFTDNSYALIYPAQNDQVEDNRYLT